MSKENRIGIITTDNDFNVLSWNSWMEVVTGIPENKIINKNLVEQFPEILERGLVKKLESVKMNGNIEVLSSIFHKYFIKCKPIIPSKYFDEMLQQVTIAPLLDESDIIGLIITIKDVTLEKEREKDAEEGKDNYHNEEVFDLISSSDWKKRKDAVQLIDKRSENTIEDIFHKFKEDHRNFNTLSSTMQILANSNVDIVDLLIDGSKSDDDDLRIYITQMMGEKKDSRIIERLIELLDDKNVNVQYHAIESLGKLRAISALEPLLKIAEKGDFFLSFPAIDSLKNIGESSIQKKLLKLLDIEIIKSAVIEALGELGDDLVVFALTDILNNEPEYTLEVSKALNKIYDKFENTLGEGKFISDLVSALIRPNGIQNVINSINIADKKDLQGLVQILSWSEGEDVERSLANLLKDSNVRSSVIDSLVKLGKKASPLLLEQARDANDELMQSIIIALGRIGDEDTVPFLIERLNDDESIVILALGALAKIGDRRAFEPLISMLGHPNPSVRRAVISALNSIGHPQLANKLIPALNDENPFVRESAIKICGYFGFEKTKEIIFRCCSDIDELVRMTAIENIPFFEDKRVFRLLKNALKNDTKKVRAAAAKALAFLDGKEVLDLLISALNDNDHWVKIAAIRSLSYKKFPEAVPYLVELIEKDKCIPVKVAGLEALGELGGGSSVAVISRYIESENDDVSDAAIKALGSISHPSSIYPLLHILRVDDPNKKIQALKSLRKRTALGTVGAIQWVAASDKNLNVRYTAIDTLKELANYEAISALIGLTADKELREYAIRALACQKEDKIDIIKEGINHLNQTVRIAAIEALSRMKNPKATEVLINCLDHKDPMIRLAAIQNIRRLGNRTIENKLRYMAINDKDPLVKLTAKEILQYNNE